MPDDRLSKLDCAPYAGAKPGRRYLPAIQPGMVICLTCADRLVYDAMIDHERMHLGIQKKEEKQ